MSSQVLTQLDTRLEFLWAHKSFPDTRRFIVGCVFLAVFWKDGQTATRLTDKQRLKHVAVTDMLCNSCELTSFNMPEDSYLPLSSRTLISVQTGLVPHPLLQFLWAHKSGMTGTFVNFRQIRQHCLPNFRQNLSPGYLKVCSKTGFLEHLWLL